MELLKSEINKYKEEINATKPASTEALEDFRIKYLGTKGIIKSLFGRLKEVAKEDKKEAGLLLNTLKKAAEERYDQFSHLKVASISQEKNIDLGLPGKTFPIGSRHPLKIVERQMVAIFERMGFEVAEGPEIEDDWHNFTSLNMAEDHTARDMQDTFYISRNPDWVLRTHTSSVQARVLEEKGRPPLRIICPGRVYRNETISARAHCFFHQCEGLYIDEHVSFADLKQTLYYFVTEIFGAGTKVRFRPSYFPFTEPSAEMDISCTVCGGSGCSLCKHSGWVEILGCGMVHPNLLRNFNIDPDKYSGFAFGMGIERITQIKYQINDLRLYSQNALPFLNQFISQS